MQVRNTNQRKLVLDIMTQNYTHPTADEIFEKARSLDEHISRGTVYRNLAFLAETGQIKKIVVPNGSDHYDCTLTPHYHFCCDNCKKLYDVPETVKVKTKPVFVQMEQNGFCVKSHNLIFTGLCPACNKQLYLSRQNYSEVRNEIL